jgi:hypothetical protein
LWSGCWSGRAGPGAGGGRCDSRTVASTLARNPTGRTAVARPDRLQPTARRRGPDLHRERIASLRDGLTFIDLPEGTFLIYADGDRRQVIVATPAITHGGFAFYGYRYGDAVALTCWPFAGASGFDGSEQAPSGWSRTSPFTSWLTLAIGFPWYVAAGVLLTISGWLLARWLRRKRPGAAATPAETPTEG